MTKSRDLGDLAQTVAVNLPTSLGTAGQSLVVNSGADGLEFGAASGGGVTVYTGLSGTDGTPSGATYLLNASSPSAGDLAYVTANTSLYQNNGNGWYRIAVINTTPTISSVADASSNTTPFTLEGGTNTVITVTASDADEGTDLTYSHSVTSGSLNGTTVTQGTGASENVFTIAPHASNATTFSITFTVSDDINAATSIAAFTLEFEITDSHYTSLLMATDDSAGDNSTIVYDTSSTTGNSLTVNGAPYAGTFSPYRHGGYSVYFDGNDYLAVTKSIDLDLDTNNWTIECWLNLTNPSALQAVYSFGYETQTTRGCIIYLYNGNLHFAYSTTGSNNTDTSMGSHGIVANEWTHLSVVRNGSTITGYINGAALGTTINIGASDIYYPSSGNVRIASDGSNFVTGYISDFRLVNGTALTPASGGPTERLTAVSGTGYSTSLLTCHLPYIADGSSSPHSITTSGDPETKPIGPYDYETYSASINGGSVYFDGSGDSLSIADNDDFDLGTGNFTFEAWAYPTALSYDYPSIISAHDGSASTSYIFGVTNTNKMVLYGGSGGIKTSTATFPLNTWVHLMATRSSGTVRFFINGTLDATTYTDNGSYDCPSTGLKIGQQAVGSGTTLRNFTGYLSDVRLIKGQALQTSTFDPPTAPLSAVTNTSLLLSGTDAHVIDKSQVSNLKLFGNAAAVTNATNNSTISSTNAVYFDGTGDYAEIPDSDLLELGSGNFSIEMWVRMTAYDSSGFNTFIMKSTGSTHSYQLDYKNGTTELRILPYTGNSPTTNIVATTTLSLNTWYHIAYVRDNSVTSNQMKIYKDGTQVASVSYSSTIDALNHKVSIGHRPGSNDRNFNGYIQDLRITKGLARHVNNSGTYTYPVPSAPLKG